MNQTNNIRNDDFPSFVNNTFYTKSPLRYSSSHTILLSTIVALLSLCTILGNITVIVAFARDPKLRKIRNYYILNLAICDLVTGCFVTVFALVKELFVQWQLGMPLCKLWLCFDFVLACESVLTLLLICWDRLLLTSKPLQYMAQQTRRRAVFKILASWIFSILLQCPVILLEGYFIKTVRPIFVCDVQAHRNPTFVRIMTMLQFIVPFILMIGMIAQIFRNIHYKTLKYSSRQRVIRLREPSYQEAPAVKKAVSRTCSLHASMSQSRSGENHHHSCYYSHSLPNVLPQGAYRLCTCRNTSFNEGFNQVAAISVQYSVLPIDWWPWKNHHHHMGNYHFCRMTNAWHTSCLGLMCHPNIPSKSRWHRWTTFAAKAPVVHRNGLRVFKFKILKRFLIIIVMVHVVCWMPYIVGEILQTLCQTCINDATHRFLYWGLYYNSTINPFVYATILKRYTLNFQKIWCSFLPEWDKESTYSEVTAKAIS